MPLPHFSNISSHNENWEPIFKALFEVTFDLPKAIGSTTQDVVLLLENTKAINLPLTKDIDVVTQRFKYSTRVFVSLPKETHVADLNIKFNLNQNDKNAVYVWNVLKAWYDKVWNSQTGEVHTKRDIVGSIIVNQHDRTGKIIRRVTYKNAQIVGIDSFDLDWENTTEIFEVSTKFVADYWEDLYISNLT